MVIRGPRTFDIADGRIKKEYINTFPTRQDSHICRIIDIPGQLVSAYPARSAKKCILIFRAGCKTVKMLVTLESVKQLLNCHCSFDSVIQRASKICISSSYGMIKIDKELAMKLFHVDFWVEVEIIKEPFLSALIKSIVRRFKRPSNRPLF